MASQGSFSMQNMHHILPSACFVWNVKGITGVDNIGSPVAWLVRSTIVMKFDSAWLAWSPNITIVDRIESNGALPVFSTIVVNDESPKSAAPKSIAIAGPNQ